MTSLALALAVIALSLTAVWLGGVVLLVALLAAGLALMCWKDPSNLAASHRKATDQ